MTTDRRTSRSPLQLAAAAACLGAGLAGCAGPAEDRQAAWPPRLNAASERMQAVESPRQRQDRAVDESGTTVLMDRPYH